MKWNTFTKKAKKNKIQDTISVEGHNFFFLGIIERQHYNNIIRIRTQVYQ